jgi:tetratricopeptide (TPR) repeat protein
MAMNEIEQKHNEVANWNRQGANLHNQRHFDEAIKCYDKALEINPHNVEAWLNKGINLNLLSRCDEAIKCFNEVLEINPQYAPAWFNKGANEDQLGLSQNAATSYRKYLELAPAQDAKFITIVRNRLQELERNLGKLNNGKQDAVAWNNKGVNLRCLGRFAEAIDYHEKALAINPQYADAWLNKGIAQDQLGLKRNAAASYRKFMELASTRNDKLVELTRQRLHQLATEGF